MSRAAIGLAEAMEMTLKAAKTALENEQCILEVAGVDRLKLGWMEMLEVDKLGKV
jgi:hypothetical protein